jgi:D-alanyl-lipoteichoic acid acyltransferase DltB (MBOAT superfamily)
LNWRRPLLSSSLHEFWTRNHISITTWFRDYLYIGLGGNRVPYKRWLLNIFLVFVISALWHGANLTFLIWGGMHGAMYIIEILIKRKFPLFKAPKIFGWIYLMSFHTISLIAFRAANIFDLSYIYRHIFSSEVFDVQTYCFNDLFQFGMITSLIVFLFMKDINEEFAFLNRHQGLYSVLKPTLYVILVLSIFMIGKFNANTFIYFQF